MPRPEAEKNPAYKQLIPYVIMAHADTFLCYVRGSGVDEERLAEKVSIGIGGHINRADRRSQVRGDVHGVYENGLLREVSEEVTVKTDHVDTIVALINDDSNDVGQVHVGVVHLWRLAYPNVQSREDDICDVRFLTTGELRPLEERMESWSKLLLANLDFISGTKS